MIQPSYAGPNVSLQHAGKLRQALEEQHLCPLQSALMGSKVMSQSSPQHALAFDIFCTINLPAEGALAPSLDERCDADDNCTATEHRPTPIAYRVRRVVDLLLAFGDGLLLECCGRFALADWAPLPLYKRHNKQVAMMLHGKYQVETFA